MTTDTSSTSSSSSQNDIRGNFRTEVSALKVKMNRLEKKLKDIQAELNHSLDNVGYAIRVINKDHTVRLINQAFADMFEVNRDEVIGSKCWKVFASQLCHTANCRANRILQGEKRIRVEVERQRRDGTTIPCIVTASPVCNANGKLIGVIEQFSDVTERQQLLRQIQESEERYRSLINLGTEAGEAVVMLQDIDGSEGIQTFVSDEWPRIVGYTREELLGMSFFDLESPGDRQASVERHRLKMSGKSVPGLFEMSIIRKDGTKVPIELTGAFTTYQRKRANVVYIREIGERKHMEKALEQSENLYRTLFDTTGTATHILDGKGAVLMVNEEWTRLFDYTKEEAEGKINYLQLVPPNKRQLIEGNFKERALNHESVPKTFDTELLTKNNKIINALLTVSMIPGTDMRVISSLDITRIKQFENRLRRSESRLRLLSRRVMSAEEAERLRIARELHDELAQELVAVRMEAASLAEKLKEPGAVQRVAGMVGAIDKLLDTVHEISTSLRPKLLDELGLVGAVQWYVEDFERRTGISCPISFHNGAAQAAVGREVAIAAYRIVQEAMVNALRHSKSDRIGIDISIRRSRLLIAVIDNGIGINMNELHDRSSLGLLGMHERAALVGGILRIRGNPGRGTRVSASLPLCSMESPDRGAEE